jgi:acetyl-CoA carboxylase carboxyl transferase subunit alpha
VGESFDFEKSIIDLEKKIDELKKLATSKEIDLSEEIKKLEAKVEEKKKEVYEKLTPWQRTQIARHINRPRSLDYINLIFEEFIELHGDRCYKDDPAIVCGLALFENIPVVVIGLQKGKDTKDNVYRNFGMASPEGYRKALRVMQLAEKFNKPIISFVDTPGAFPGMGSEERSVAEAIAKNLRDMSGLKVPIIVIVHGEGGSGGALGIAVGDRVLMLENAVYSVISPEGCAAILWKDSKKAPEAATALKLTAQDLLKFNVIDEIIKEPLGGAHRDHEKTAKIIKEAIRNHLNELLNLDKDELLKRRYKKFRDIGRFLEIKSEELKES